LQADHAQLYVDGEKNEKARTFKLISERVTDLLPEILNDLNQNGYITNTTVDTVQSTYNM